MLIFQGVVFFLNIPWKSSRPLNKKSPGIVDEINHYTIPKAIFISWSLDPQGHRYHGNAKGFAPRMPLAPNKALVSENGG